jgi:hypothetical protein
MSHTRRTRSCRVAREAGLQRGLLDIHGQRLDSVRVEPQVLITFEGTCLSSFIRYERMHGKSHNLCILHRHKSGDRFVVKVKPVQIKGVRIIVEHMIETLPDRKVR